MKAITRHILILLFTFGVSLTDSFCQTSQSSLSGDLLLPEIFMLGDEGQLYENEMPKYQTLLEACSDDMPVAFQKLYSMMKEMEAYADLVGYDLKGVNAWMHFFWDKDGSIEHIGYHLKPNSKNVDTDKLEVFLKDFARHYKFPLVVDEPYAHYSSFAFPIL